MSKKLDLQDRETVISFNEADDECAVFTYSRRLQSHLERLGVEPESQNGFGGASYIIPKSWLRDPRPRKAEREARKAAGGLNGISG
jgi:hypothetical protein